jgi:hypothetical protein
MSWFGRVGPNYGLRYQAARKAGLSSLEAHSDALDPLDDDIRSALWFWEA